MQLGSGLRSEMPRLGGGKIESGPFAKVNTNARFYRHMQAKNRIDDNSHEVTNLGQSEYLPTLHSPT